MLSVMRLVCFVMLFAWLCVIGGELCASGGLRLLPALLGHDRVRDMREPGPMRPREEAFRGVSPLPEVGGRLRAGHWRRATWASSL